MPHTLILLFHPEIAHSRANVALAAAAAASPGVTVVDLQALYPHGRIDADREVARLLAADRIVLQFPVQWYSTPPLLKAWQDLILTRMYYIDYENEGRRLEGKPLMVAATAGNTAESYRTGGRNLYALTELLKPLETTAHRCGLPWGEPFLLFEANKLDAPALTEAGLRYAKRLQDWSCGRGAVVDDDRPPEGRDKRPRLLRARDRSTPGLLPFAALSIPVIVATELALASLSWSSGAGLADWPSIVGLALMAPIVWIFLAAVGLASARPLRPWAALLMMTGLAHLAIGPGWLRAATGGLIALSGMVVLAKLRKRRRRQGRVAGQGVTHGVRGCVNPDNRSPAPVSPPRERGGRRTAAPLGAIRDGRWTELGRARETMSARPKSALKQPPTASAAIAP